MRSLTGAWVERGAGDGTRHAPGSRDGDGQWRGPQGAQWVNTDHVAP
jgi:hypothetical protein